MSTQTEPRVLCVGTWFTAPEAAALRAAAQLAGCSLSELIRDRLWVWFVSEIARPS